MIYDYQNCIDFAREKGEAKGRAEGKAEGEKLAKIETARNLLKENAPIDMICRVTSLSEKDIENLLRS